MSADGMVPKTKPTLKLLKGWEKNCYEKEKLSLLRVATFQI